LCAVILARVAGAQTTFPFARDVIFYETLPAKFFPKDSLLAKANKNSDTSNDIAGYVFKSKFDVSNTGIWKKFSDQYDTWILKFNIKKVAGIAVIFSDLKLDRRAKLFVYNLYDVKAVDRDDIPPSGILPIEYLAGEEIVIELDVPSGSRSSFFSVDAISFTDNASLVNRSFVSFDNERTASCYTCLTGKFWENPKKATVKIIIFRESEAIMCTGALINNTARDARPYILTAQHCITDQQDADNSLFVFGDNDVNCDGVGLQRSSISGCMLRAASYQNDFSLVELHNYVPLNAHPYFAGWDVSGVPVEHVSCVHHPLGGAKKISVRHNQIEISDFLEGDKPLRATQSFWHIQQWDEGITEAGSSGSPLFNEEQRIIGTLTGGSSSCDAPYNDFFERLSVAWIGADDVNNKLQHWLDPQSSGIEILDGFDPFNSGDDTCDTLRRAMSLYPNPTVGQLIVTLPDEDDEIAAVQLYNAQGGVCSADFDLYSDTIMINTSSLKSATYVFKVITGRNVYVGRFVKL
jgi:hypothetical protein